MTRSYECGGEGQGPDYHRVDNDPVNDLHGSGSCLGSRCGPAALGCRTSLPTPARRSAHEATSSEPNPAR